MKKFILALLLTFALAAPALAQVSVPNTFVTGTPILASEMNANFDALESGSLNRAGGTITGNIVVDPGVTIDGVDISATIGPTANLSINSLTTAANAVIGTTLAVTGNVAINTNKFNITASN